MTGPRGLCNPTRAGQTGTYGGTPFGVAGQTNLAQIGGGQNTFGVPGTGSGQDVVVDAGIGQSAGGQVIAYGSFPAPEVPGVYAFSLQAAIANTLQAVRPAPDSSPAAAASVLVNGAGLSFTVCRPADVDGDGTVSFTTDIPAFVDILLGPDAPGGYARCAADLNGDGAGQRR